MLSPAPASGLGLLHGGGGAGHGGSLLGAWGWRLGLCCPAVAPHLGSGRALQHGKGLMCVGQAPSPGAAGLKQGCGRCEGRQRGSAQRMAPRDVFFFPHFSPFASPPRTPPGAELTVASSCHPSHERAARPRRLLADPEVQVILSLARRRLDVPAADHGTGPVQLRLPGPGRTNTNIGAASNPC